MSFEDSVLICDVVDPILNKILTDNGLKVSYEPEITPDGSVLKYPAPFVNSLLFVGIVGWF